MFHPGFIQCNSIFSYIFSYIFSHIYTYSLMQKFNNIKRVARMKPQLTSDRLVVVGGSKAVLTLF